jgi:tetratricopeptide (TPR) repeat protein
LAEERPFVAREEDVEALRAHWSAAKAGNPRVVRFVAPFGGGRRAVMGELLSEIQSQEPDAILWRVACLDQENGVQWLIRMYGALVATLTSDVLRRGRIELLLNAQMPSQPRRVQGWYTEFIAALKEAKTDAASGSVQLKMPRDNPLLGLVEIATAISRKAPVLLDLQAPWAVNSMALAQFVEALIVEAKESNAQLLIVAHDEPESDMTRSVHPMPWLDFCSRRTPEVVALAPWGAAEVGRFMASRGKSGNAEAIARISGGRPGYCAELIEMLEAKGTLSDALTDVTFAGLLPLEVDASELDLPSEPPAEGQRKHATPEDADRIAFFGALLGAAFPSGLVADIGGYDRDSVDDLIDAMPEMFEQVQFSDQLSTWLYKFKRGSYREGVLERNNNDAGHDLARRVGLFMERTMVPRGYAFIAKTARIYGEHQAYGRASLMRGMALGNDAKDVWGLCHDLTQYFDEITWPDPMVRTIYTNLVEHLVASGAVNVADQVHGKATEWATAREDRDLTAWLLLSGSRLDLRRQDVYRARDRARDALTMFTALENKARAAEVQIHLAQIELQDGNPNAALDHVNQALTLGRVPVEGNAGGQEGQVAVAPTIAANSEWIRGTVLRRSGKAAEAVQHFQRANAIAGQTGMAPLAVAAGLGLGEALLSSGQFDKSEDVLRQMAQITANLRDAGQEHAAVELLAQACGAQRKFDDAVRYASRALELARALKYDQVVTIDMFNLGRFHLMNNKPTEALALFKQVAPALTQQPNTPLGREFQYFFGVSLLRSGNLDDAKNALRAVLGPAQAAKDWAKLISALEHLATIEEQRGNKPVAKKLLADAIAFAKQADLQDLRKQLKRRLDDMA